MSAIFDPAPNRDRPIRLINVQTLGACCGTFESYEAAFAYLRSQGYSEDDFGANYGQRTVWFRGGINC